MLGVRSDTGRIAMVAEEVVPCRIFVYNALHCYPYLNEERSEESSSPRNRSTT
jgi:hypothetical protein